MSTLPLVPPTYLRAHTDLWRRSPREANRAWFREAGFGLFIHYGLYSQLQRHEWVLHREAIPLADGSIHPDDVACLREVGRRLRAQGWPAPDASAVPDARTDAKGA